MDQSILLWAMAVGTCGLGLAFFVGLKLGSRNATQVLPDQEKDNRTRLERQVKELSTLHAFATASADADSFDTLIERVTHIVGDSLRPHYFGILLVERGYLREHASYNHDPSKRNIERIKVRLGEGVVGNVAVGGKPTRDGDVVNNPVYLGFGSDTQSELAVPIHVGSEVIGVINLESKQRHAFTPDDERLLVTLANHLGVAMEKMRLFEQVQQLARTDALTDIPNRRHILDQGQREMDRATRYRHPLSIVMMDVDNFKQVNDTYGHAIGDQILKEVALRSHQSLRESDSVGRYGGEEFLALLPETDGQGAARNAERLCEAFSDKPVKTSKGAMTVSVSIGIASFPEDGDNIEVLINLADQALYAAKQAGRNTYRSWSDPAPQQICEDMAEP